MPDMVGFSENGNAAIVAFCSTQITKRCRRQAPARGAGAVYSLHLLNRTETQSARPLLLGRALVYTAPTALAGDTVA